MAFIKYQHVSKLGNTETEGILNGKVYIFEKLDGTNASIWKDDEGIHCGSRRLELSYHEDNRSFFKTFHEDERFVRFFKKYPNVRLFGEYLVPHQVKYYHAEAWNKFYVFDVIKVIPGIDLENDNLEHFEYLPYEEYKEMLEEFDIDYIPVVAVFNDPTQEDLLSCLDKTTFLSDEPGEGIVCKNYSFKNRFGRTQWAKIVRDEFLQKKKVHRTRKNNDNYDEVVDRIIRNYVTESFIQKEREKLNEAFEYEGKDIHSEANKGQYIGRLLEGTYKTFLEEETYNIVKKLKQPTINYKKLKNEFINKIKETFPELFK